MTCAPYGARAIFLCPVYHLNDDILVRKVLTLFSAISDIHLEILCQQVCAIFSEISKLLLAFNAVPVVRGMYVIV